jgi:hypothetical protein
MITLADLPRIFEKAGYERDGLAKIGAILPQGRAVDPALVEETTSEPTPANICARLFYMARSVTREHAELALTAPMCELLLAEGLLTKPPMATARKILARPRGYCAGLRKPLGPRLRF